MSIPFKKLCNDYGIIGILCVLVIVYVIYRFGFLVMNKGKSGHEGSTNMSSSSNSSSNSQQPISSNVVAAQPLDSSEYSSIDASSSPQLQGTSGQDPSALLPKDSNSQWSQLNPNGQGALENTNLLKTGYHQGIDTVSSSLRNANLQLRSDPTIARTNTGPWQQSTIEGDSMRKSFEIGGGC